MVALGIAAAPLVSLLVVPWAIERRGRAAGERGSMREGAGFAGAVLAIMVAEQALLNGPVIAVDATAADAALAGFVFNVLLITRAPLQLFQAIQTSLLPHLSGLAATGGGPEFRHAIRVTVLAIAGFAGAVVIGLGLIGPWAMGVLFGGDFDYARGGLVLVGLGMGFHLTAGHAQPGGAGARRRGAQAAAAWLASAALFLIWLLVDAARRPGAGRRGRLLRHDRAAGRGAVGHRSRRSCAWNVRSDGRVWPLGPTRAESHRGRRSDGAIQLYM